MDTGLLTLGGVVALLALASAACALVRRWKRREHHPLAFGSLCFAAATGDLEGVKALVDLYGIDCSCEQEKRGWTALAAAAARGHTDVVEWLVQAGADPCSRSRDGWRDSPLGLAAASGYTETALVLMRAGAPLSRDFAGISPARQAAYNGFDACAQAIDAFAEACHGPAGAGAPIPGLILGRAGSGSSRLSAPPPCMSAGEVDPDPARRAKARILASDLLLRGWEGIGTPGVSLLEGTWFVRGMLMLSSGFGTVYMIWRAAKTFNPENLALSAAFYLCELAVFLPSFVFLLELWGPIGREELDIQSLHGLEEEDYPSVDVLIPCMKEAAWLIEATVCAALNVDYPEGKLRVYLCDDGGRAETRAMVQGLSYQDPALLSSGRLTHVVRPKVDGVPHYAKAGNINHALMKAGSSGDLVVVFDSDMIAKPNFLRMTAGHFLEQHEGRWRLKPKVAFLQVPQDFHNVPLSDPMGHRARFFYGPMMQGRDGAGAAPCVGTGVVFRRDALIAIGGQAYGSITEDYNTSMMLMAAGFASIYINSRLIYGLAPDDIHSVLKQRLRWATGSLQIIAGRGCTSPLLMPGLTWKQRLLFFQSGAQYMLGVPIVFMAALPVAFMFRPAPPLRADLVEFLFFFFTYYFLNRLTLWAAHRRVESGSMELWRGSQTFVWSCPNNIKACCKALGDLLGVKVAVFSVTSKCADAPACSSTLCATWPFLLYYIAALAGVGVFICRALVFPPGLSAEEVAAQLVAVIWTGLVMMYLWPPLAPLLGGGVEDRVASIAWTEPGPIEGHTGRGGGASGGRAGAGEAGAGAVTPLSGFGSVNTPRDEALEDIMRLLWEGGEEPNASRISARRKQITPQSILDRRQLSARDAGPASAGAGAVPLMEARDAGGAGPERHGISRWISRLFRAAPRRRRPRASPPEVEEAAGEPPLDVEEGALEQPRAVTHVPRLDLQGIIMRAPAELETHRSGHSFPTAEQHLEVPVSHAVELSPGQYSDSDSDSSRTSRGGRPLGVPPLVIDGFHASPKGQPISDLPARRHPLVENTVAYSLYGPPLFLGARGAAGGQGGARARQQVASPTCRSSPTFCFVDQNAGAAKHMFVIVNVCMFLAFLVGALVYLAA